MSGIRYGKVIVGGLVAGIVINFFEFVTNSFVLKEDWAQVMRALNKPEEITGSQIVFFNIWGFVMGILAVWLYAAIKPRFGSGKKTAILAALALWVSGYVLSMLPPAIMDLFPVKLVVVALAIGLCEIVVATIAGSLVYKEEIAASDMKIRTAPI